MGLKLASLILGYPQMCEIKKTNPQTPQKIWTSVHPYEQWGKQDIFIDYFWGPSGEGNGKPLQYSCLDNPMNSMKRHKDKTLKDELPRLVGAQYATGDQWRNNSRKNEKRESKEKQHPAVDATGDGSRVQCYEEQYCIGTWNVRSMNQGKLEWLNRRWQEWTLTF